MDSICPCDPATLSRMKTENLNPENQNNETAAEKNGATREQISKLIPQAPGETNRAYEAFRVYWNLGQKRRVYQVCNKSGAHFVTVKRWKKTFDWKARVKVCNAHLLDQRVQTEAALQSQEIVDTAHAAKDKRQRRCDLANVLFDAVEHFFDELDPDDIEDLSISDACKLLEIALQLQNPATTNDQQPVQTRGAQLFEAAISGFKAKRGQTPNPNPQP
jgi:hypothetical protein